VLIPYTFLSFFLSFIPQILFLQRRSNRCVGGGFDDFLLIGDLYRPKAFVAFTDKKRRMLSMRISKQEEREDDVY
jgi:hypothetical protein